jgi:hypothetical protein
MRLCAFLAAMSSPSESLSAASPSSGQDGLSVPWADPARREAFESWLAGVAGRHGLRPGTVRAASSDASFRRYLRVDADGCPASFIVMDAPPDKEDCGPFVKVARLLQAGGVAAPAILEWDEAQGFMLLSDLGGHTLLSVLVPEAEALSAADADNRARYAAALDELVRLQGIAAEDQVPPYDDALLQRELDLLPQWYLTQLRGLTLTDAQQQVLERSFGLIKAQVLGQPRVLVHRDYHSRNLMVKQGDPRATPGVIDFQDAVWGPVTYDLVSLLRDAYVVWDEEVQIDHAVRYWEKARKAGVPVPDDFGDFWRDFEWMGLQRHLKVLGIFARLALRDGKRQYLDDIPRVWRYAHRVCTRYNGLGPLAALLEVAEAETLGIQRQAGYTF